MITTFFEVIKDPMQKQEISEMNTYLLYKYIQCFFSQNFLYCSKIVINNKNFKEFGQQELFIFKVKRF